MERVQCVVIGAGVVGLAVARAFALRGQEVMVLEAAEGIGMGTSSRNSEVIHAGLYYPTGSLKAQLCVHGKHMLYDYCAERGVPHQRCGKLLVATTPEQIVKMDQVMQQAHANGVHDLQRLSAAQAQSLEPALSCTGALLSPSTGIVDTHALMLSLQGDLEHAAGMVALRTRVTGVQVCEEGLCVHTHDGMELLAQTVVNSAGLHAPALAQCIEGLPAQYVPQAYFAKGNYFTLSARSPFSRLIYPLPEAAGLGVHLTIDLGGQAKFGPDVQWVDDDSDYVVDVARAHDFYEQIRRYWPALPDGALQPGYAGIRPKIQAPHEPARDFVIQTQAEHGVHGLVNLFGIESPGLTSCLALGEWVVSGVERSVQQG